MVCRQHRDDVNLGIQLLKPILLASFDGHSQPFYRTSRIRDTFGCLEHYFGETRIVRHGVIEHFDIQILGGIRESRRNCGQVKSFLVKESAVQVILFLEEVLQ
jgi:hypothetical protein